MDGLQPSSQVRPSTTSSPAPRHGAAQLQLQITHPAQVPSEGADDAGHLVLGGLLRSSLPVAAQLRCRQLPLASFTTAIGCGPTPTPPVGPLLRGADRGGARGKKGAQPPTWLPRRQPRLSHKRPRRQPRPLPKVEPRRQPRPPPTRPTNQPRPLPKNGGRGASHSRPNQGASRRRHAQALVEPFQNLLHQRRHRQLYRRGPESRLRLRACYLASHGRRSSDQRARRLRRPRLRADVLCRLRRSRAIGQRLCRQSCRRRLYRRARRRHRQVRCLASHGRRPSGQRARRLRRPRLRPDAPCRRLRRSRAIGQRLCRQRHRRRLDEAAEVSEVTTRRLRWMSDSLPGPWAVAACPNVDLCTYFSKYFAKNRVGFLVCRPPRPLVLSGPQPTPRELSRDLELRR